MFQCFNEVLRRTGQETALTAHRPKPFQVVHVVRRTSRRRIGASSRQLCVSGDHCKPTALNIEPDFRCFFSRGHDPITWARRARCPARVGSIFNECCHCPTGIGHSRVRTTESSGANLARGGRGHFLETCCQTPIELRGNWCKSVQINDNSSLCGNARDDWSSV